MAKYGRTEIYTDYREVNSNNVVDILQAAMPIHLANVSRMNFLLDFDAGIQPLPREKKTRIDIDIHSIDNIAHQAVAFNEAYHWGNPITFVQRGVKDSNTDTENEAKAIALFNECYSAEKADSKTQMLGRFIEITGIAYTFVDINMDWQEGDSYFNYETLDPRYAFVVKSSKLGHKPLLGVTYSEDSFGNRYFTCFSERNRFEVVAGKIVNGEKKKGPSYEWSQNDRSGELNPIGRIPIIECILGYDRMGCFEREIDGLCSLNLLESDICNATDETVQAIWHSNDVNFPTDENGNVLKPEHGDWLQTFTSPDGKTPFVTPLSLNFDYAGNINFVNAKRSYLLEQLCIPQRNSTSGGSSGIAMDSATGWNAAENKANAIENITKGWKMEEAKVALEAIKQSPFVPADSPLLNLKAMDIVPSIKRNKNYELTVKSQFVSTMLKAGFAGEHIVKTANLFEDPHQVWIDSKDTVEKIQETYFKDKEVKEDIDVEGNSSVDPINQINNSPNLDKDRG